MTPKYDIQSDALLADALIELGLTGSPVPAQKVSMNSTTITVLNQLIEEPTLSKSMIISQEGTIKVRSFVETPLGYDPLITDWANRVVANGGAAPSDSTKTALNTFYTALVSNGLASKMKALNCFVPDNLIAALTPLIKTYGNDPWTNSGLFVSGDLSVNGLVGDGAAKYLNTGVVPNQVYTYTNMAATVYVAGTLVNTDATLFGSTYLNGGFPILQLLPRLSNNLYCDFPIEAAVACRITGGNTTGGYFCVSRTSAARVDLYKANSSIGHTTFGTNTYNLGPNDYITPNNYPFFCQAINLTGTAGQFSADYITFLAFHSSVTAGESATLYGLVQALRQQLGGGYV